MLANRLTIFYRNFLSQKSYSIINLVGLSIGLASLLACLFYINFQLSYDRFHTHSSRIYRLLWIEGSIETQTKPSIINFSELATTLRGRITGLEKTARLEKERNAIVQLEGKAFSETNFYWADPELLAIFDLPMLYGNPNALSEPNAVALTRAAAIKYFGTENSMGKTLRVGKHSLLVRAVLKDLPANTHLTFAMLGSYKTLGKTTDVWQHQGVIYLMAAASTDPARFASLVEQQARKLTTWIKLQEKDNYKLQPLDQVHLHSSGFVGETTATDVSNLYIAGAIAAIVILATCFNYVNLATARAISRAKEVGVRKAVGASQNSLIIQFLFESVLLCLIAMLIAFVLVTLILPWINDLLNSKISFGDIAGLNIIIKFLGLSVATGFLAGIYPAFYLSGFQPSVVLKGVSLNLRDGLPLQKVLITLQFFMASVLLGATLVINKQLAFLQNKDLGYTKENIVLLTTPFFSKLNASYLKQELLSLPAVSEATIASGTPLDGGWDSVDTLDGLPRKVHYMFVDHDYLKTLTIPLVAGREFTAPEVRDTSTVILINHTWQKPTDGQSQSEKRFQTMKAKEQVSLVWYRISILARFTLRFPRWFLYPPARRQPMFWFA